MVKNVMSFFALNRLMVSGLMLFIILLTILQDFIYSRIQDTGFYFVESFTYNTFWLFFVPIGWLILRTTQSIFSKNLLVNTGFYLGLGAITSLFHLVVFSLFFVLISNLFFYPPHRFITIFKSSLSNQLYITFLIYTFGPIFYHLYIRKKISNGAAPLIYPEQLRLKIGKATKIIKASSIHLIATDKPYTIVCTKSEKLMLEKSLKGFERILDPDIFIRVHRSSIINKNYIQEMNSRKNGDYDVTLENGQNIRFSRHYRKNWESLLH